VSTDLQGYVNETWGYYPITNPYSSSSGSKSWQPAPGILEDDDTSGHNGQSHAYTDYREYTINHGQLVAGLTYTKNLALNPGNYEVETANCTDKAIAAAAAAGVSLPSAEGFCSHLTHSFMGNCPGTLGENLNP
jgi:hypothetical protein